MKSKTRKREQNGRYDYDGDLKRLCVCGHTLGQHSGGSPADCLAYSLSDASDIDKACRCQKFRLSRKKKPL